MVAFLFWVKKAPRKNQNGPVVTVSVRSAFASYLCSNNTDNVKQVISLIHTCLYTYFFPIWEKRKQKICSKTMFPPADDTKSVSRLGP